MATTFLERLVQPAGGTQYVAISATANNALSNLSLSAGTTFNNVSGGTAGLDGSPMAWAVLTYSVATSPAAGGSISLWLLGAKDHGSDGNYEDGGSVTTPTQAASPVPDRPPDVIFPCATTSSLHQIEMPVFLKVGWQKPLIQNNTGKTFSSDNTNNVLYFCSEQRNANG